MNQPRITSRYQPRDWQRRAHAQIAGHRFNVLVVHRRAGKTVMAINLLIAACLARPNGRFAYFAPTLKQAKQISWGLLKEYTANIPGIDFKEAELRVIFPTGSEIQLFSGEQHDAARGMGFDGVVLDEIANFPPDAWPSSIRPTLSDRGGWATFIGTPNGLDLFHEFYQRGQDPSQTEWWSALYPVTATGVLPQSEVESARNSAVSTAAFRREYMCDFTASADDVLIPLELIQRAQGRSISFDGALSGAEKVVGVDVARFGSDRTVFFSRWGKQALPPIVIEQADLMHTVGLLTQLIDRWKPDATFIDEGGVGGGVIDRCRQIGFDVVGVNFGARAIDPRYLNRRAEMWFALRDWLQDGGILPDDPGLLADLSAPQFSFDAGNRLKLEPKDQIKKRMGKSTDLGDGLALTFAFPVMPAGRSAHGHGFTQTQHSFDPFEEAYHA